MSRAARPDSSPARFAAPRTVFIIVVAALVAFGMLMIYSSSSITSLISESNNFNPAYYLIRQAGFGFVGLVVAGIIALVDYHVWARSLALPIWLGVVALLALILIPGVGQGAYGAVRWFQVGPVTIQPSEFAKVALVMCSATLIERHWQNGNPLSTSALHLGVEAGIPLLLIIREPDKGTCLIIGVTLLVMLWLSGLPTKPTLIAGGLAFVLFVLHGLSDPYSRERFLTMWDPWRDPHDAGYQLIQGYYAFGSGGLFGVGLGMSRQKYAYLPMAYNDFIYPIIGEELGLMGTLGLLAAFFVLVWTGYEIARHASDLSGRLIAAGSVTLLGVQMLVNVFGVLGMMPMSGKPIPFVSYGGSSIIASMALAGLVVSVSLHSSLPETVYDQRRNAMRLYEGSPMGSGGLTVLDGGGTTPEALRASRDFTVAHGGRITRNANGSQRINLGRGATDRLRGRDGRS